MNIKELVDQASATFLANSPHADVARFKEIAEKLNREGVLKKPEYSLPMIGASNRVYNFQNEKFI
jgi:hypothetical protein